MAYQRKRKTYRLDFAGTEYDGLVVNVKGLTTGEYLELVTLTGATGETNNETEKLLKLLATHIVSWNLQDGGVDIPTTYEGITANDLSMNMFIINAWTDAMVTVSSATEKKSLPGEPTLVGSIPMETL